MQVEFVLDLNDVIVFIIAVFIALFVLIVADFARRKLNLKTEFTRRIVHLFAGLAIWTVPYFTHAWAATFVALLFVIFLYLASGERFGKFFSAMARPEDLENQSVRGPFWYAMSITILTAIFTITGYEMLYFVAGAAIHIMMFGDGMSAPIGMKYGQNSTRIIFGSKRSVPGSLALFIFGFLGALLAFWWFGVIPYDAFTIAGEIQWVEMFLLAFIGATTATIVELFSPKGTDNIALPLISCVVIFAVGIALGVVVF
ncbi:MAG: diacylglycerol/polyprenol kinase family protein [Candidatus Thorarchaeota archaeon]|jgi:phytol kinase